MRRAEPRITDPAHHPRRYVGLRVAAIYLECDERLVRKYLDSGVLPFAWRGQRRKIELADLLAFEERQRVRGVPRETAERSKDSTKTQSGDTPSTA